MYLHLPSILTAYLSYFLVFIGSGMYLWKREKRDDILAHSAAEIGVLFTALTIIEGSIWGNTDLGCVVDLGCAADADGDFVADLRRLFDAALADRRRRSRRRCGRGSGHHRFSRHPADSHVGVLVAHPASAAVDSAAGQGTVGKRPSGHAHRVGRSVSSAFCCFIFICSRCAIAWARCARKSERAGWNRRA